jgi:CubicO group peptidase (beta-lactamase class C family)
MKNIKFLGLSLLMCSFCFAQKEQKMDELVTAYVKNNSFNGTVLVAQNGKILLEKGYGLKNAENKTLHDAASVFQIGSITKQFTAAIIMQLVQEKKLSLKDPLSKYFKGFANGDKITIEHLLTHQSGIYNYTNDSVIMQSDVTKSYNAETMIDIFRKYPADFEPGAKFNYSNSGYSMLGYIAAKVAKKPYEKLVRERIFQPLGMTHSGFDFSHLKDANKSKGYFYLASDSVIAAPIVDSTIAYSAGAIYSTVGDLYRWDRAISSGRLLDAASWKAVFTPQKAKYGYGWAIDSIYGRLANLHSGGIHGFASFILRIPQDDLVVITLDNSSGTSGGVIARSLAAIALDKKYTIPSPKNEIELDSTVLKQYVGEYQLAPAFTIKIFLEGKQLKAQATNQPAFDLFAEKENLFFLKVVDAKVEFIKNGQGEVEELVLYQGGQSPRGKKIK